MDFNVGKIVGNVGGRLQKEPRTKKKVKKKSRKTTTTSKGRAQNTTTTTAGTKTETVVTQCFPLYALLAAIGQGVKTVDYFSLDVEGNEFQVLTTIPWDQVLIRVMSIEFIHDDVTAQEMVEYMERKGYRVVTSVINGGALANDFIFAHKSVGFRGRIPDVLSGKWSS